MAPQQGQQRLRFKQPLTWKAGRAISVSDLLSRLRALGKELKDADQDEFATETLDNAAKELVSPQLLTHKDNGVRAETAHCLVDVLRLYAPDAPYTPAQLKDIYSLFVNTVIHALRDTTHPYHSQHLYVINSLADVKSIVLLADIAGASTLIVRLFSECFDVLSLSSAEIGRHVEYNLNGILTCMVEEAEALPPDAVDTIIAQFLHADQSIKPRKAGKDGRIEDGQHKLQRTLPAAYQVARNICNTCVGQMSRYVSQYFSNIIIDASSFGSGDGDGHVDITEEDLKQLDRAHRLLRELWRACPGILANVIPQVETELGVENIDVRLISMKAIGDLIAGIGPSEDIHPPQVNAALYSSNQGFANQDRPISHLPQSFSQVYPMTFQLFLSRRHDKSYLIRSAWVESVGRILATSAGGTGLEQAVEKELVKMLNGMVNDTDDRVRIASLHALSLLNVNQIVQIFGPSGGMDDENSVLYNMAERCRDRKAAVRAEAITAVARLWAMSFPDLIDGRERVVELLGSAPSKVFNAYYLNDSETNVTINKVLFEYLCPVSYPVSKDKSKPAINGERQAKDELPDPDALRVQRILLLMRGLDERARPVFLALVDRPQKLGQFIKAFLSKCEENAAEDDSNKSSLNKLIAYLASQRGENGDRAREDLFKYAKMNDRRSHHLIRFCMAHDSDIRKVQKALKELDRKFDATAQNASLYVTIRPLVLMVCNVWGNKSHIRHVIAYAQSNEDGLASAAHEFLKHITDATPDVFKSHSVELCQSLVDTAPQDAESASSNSMDALKACASFARKFSREVPKDRKFVQALTKHALFGSPPRAAKHAVTIILSSTDMKLKLAKDLAQSCTKDFAFGARGFLSRLACLSQLMLLAAEELEDEADAIINIAINDILKPVRASPSSPSKVDWSDKFDEEIEAKIWALRILTNRLRHYFDPESISTISPDTYKLLNTLIANRGALTKPSSDTTPLTHRSRLHLQAAFAILKLSTNRRFDTLLDPTAFHDLCFTSQDPIPQVRAAFVNKVKKLLGQDRLSSRFYVPVLILAFEPSKRLKDDTVTWLRSRAAAQAAAQARLTSSSNEKERRRAAPVLEQSLTRLISLLAHHPDYSDDPDDLRDFTRYFTFYLSCVASATNLGLVYAVAQRVKSVADNITPETWEGDTDADASRRLYVLSDLAQATIRAWGEGKGWSLQTPAGKVGMPSGIFKPLPNHQTAQEIAERHYLPEEVHDSVEGLVREALGKTGSKKRKDDDEVRKKKAQARILKSARPPKRKSTPLEAEEEEDAPSSEEEWGSSRKKRRSGRAPSEAEGEGPASERRKAPRRSRGRISYADTRESDDEKDLMEWQSESAKKTRGPAVKPQKSKTTAKEPVAVDGAADDDSELSAPPSEAEEPEQQDEGEDAEMVDAGSKANASPAKDDFDISSDNDDNKSGSSKENATPKGKAPARGRKLAAKAKAEPRAGTRTSGRRAKA